MKDYYVDGVKQTPLSKQIGFIIGVLMTLLVFWVVGCTQENSVKIDDSKANSRIKLKEYRVIHDYNYAIISVDDSIEFLVLPGHAVVKLK